jgi:NADPH:quinone reductase-like Zn-dependent oxidoreductase
MGTRDELIALTNMLVTTGIRPQIDRVLPLADAAAGFAAMIAGDHFGKIIFEPDAGSKSGQAQHGLRRS